MPDALASQTLHALEVKFLRCPCLTNTQCTGSKIPQSLNILKMSIADFGGRRCTKRFCFFVLSDFCGIVFITKKHDNFQQEML